MTTAHTVEPHDLDPLTESLIGSILGMLDDLTQNEKREQRKALKRGARGPNLSSQVFDFAPMTLRVPASSVHDIVCGAKRSLHVLLAQGGEPVPAYTTAERS